MVKRWFSQSQVFNKSCRQWRSAQIVLKTISNGSSTNPNPARTFHTHITQQFVFPPPVTEFLRRNVALKGAARVAGKYVGLMAVVWQIRELCARWLRNRMCASYGGGRTFRLLNVAQLADGARRSRGMNP
jgi:hypothetical protein